MEERFLILVIKGIDDLYRKMTALTSDLKEMIIESEEPVLVLVENKLGFECVEDLDKWVNQKFYYWRKGNIYKPVSNEKFIEIIKVYENTYDCQFLFCENAVQMMHELLND